MNNSMGQMIRGLFKLSRPLSTLTGVLAVALGGYVAGTGEWGMIALAALRKSVKGRPRTTARDAS